MNTKTDDNWLYVISSQRKLLDFNFKEIWRYRDLLFLFVKRDIITVYKQTILGPLWFVIQPLFASIVFTLIFNNMANIPTGEGVPAFLFNMAGITCWGYFKECLMGTSDTFVKNQSIFGKVYFPRVIMPLSIVVSNLLKFGIQLAVFAGFYIFFFFEGAKIQLQSTLILFPILILVMAFTGLGFGMLISSMTTKYRDLSFLVQFGTQLLMYGSAVMYPISFFKERLPEWAWVVEYNPIAIIVEAFRAMVLNTSEISGAMMIYAISFSVVVFLLGLLVFNRTERKFIDTI